MRLMMSAMVALALVSQARASGIVDRTATRDTLSVPFQFLDSLGEAVDAVSGDSVFAVVFSPGGSVVFKDSMAYDDGSIKSCDWEDFAGGKHYTYTERVSVLDGSSTANGVFAYQLVAWDNSLSLQTHYYGTFQIANSTLESSLDSSGLAAANSSKALDSLGLIIDSLQATLDSLQNQDDWVGNFRYAYTDSVLRLRGLEIIGTGANDTAVVIKGSGAGQAMLAQSTDGIAMKLDGLNDSDLVANVIGDIGGLVTPTDTNSSGDTLARLGDSTAFQGSGSSASEIADAVWDESQSGHTSAGTFGKYLDSEISGISSGTGAYTVTIVVYDTSLAQVVPGVDLAVRNVSQTALVAIGATGADGSSSFNLDADSFVVVPTTTGYLFGGCDTVVISGSTVDTVVGYRFDPGTPDSPGLCRVYGYLIDVQGYPETSATIRAHLPQGVVRTSGHIVSPFLVSRTSDSTGYFYLDLIPSDSLSGDLTSYEVSISRSDGTVFRKRITVPAVSNWELIW
ncbi:MAG: hypothetical protein JSU65_07500 [Candidatus Zixiibacteriota bacterium]|nr:MAG: hypothetical protein JSU65_07500 [candidate division Zixibacteria bacterium]